MRDVPKQILEALDGSSIDAGLSCTATYDGEAVTERLEVSDWKLSWRLGEQQTIQGSADFTFEDGEGKLSPWGFAEPLAVGGSQIEAVFECAGETVPMGSWLIVGNNPNETWRLTRRGHKDAVAWVSGGATVPVTAADLTQIVANSKFMAPDAPPRSGSSVFAEIERLCDGLIGVEFTAVEDRPVPKTMVYPEERINAVADLARMVGDYRVTGDGLLEIFDPERPAEPHWKIEPGPGGTMITVDRQQSQDELFNAVTATSQTEAGEELRAYATLDTGDLRFDGPFGRKPTEMTGVSTNYNSLMLEARAFLAEQIESATTMLNVHCSPNPIYEIGDWGQIAQPVIDGTTRPLIGRCVEVEMSGSASSGLGPMKLGMECSTVDVLAVSRYIRRTEL